MTGHVLILDDDQFLVSSLNRLLSSSGFSVTCAHGISEGRSILASHRPDLLVLDLSLPDGDGIDFCREVRKSFDFPILMLTSRSESIDKVLGFEVGADDYLTKPFDPHEFIARIKALLRRHKAPERTSKDGAVISLGNVELDTAKRTVFVAGSALALTQTEFDLLHYLVERKETAIPREKLFESVWGFSSEFTTNSLDVLMYRVRTKLSNANAGVVIHTVRGFGFRISASDV